MNVAIEGIFGRRPASMAKVLNDLQRRDSIRRWPRSDCGDTDEGKHDRRSVEEDERQDLPDVPEIPEEDEERRQQQRESEDERDELEVVERREQAPPATDAS